MQIGLFRATSAFAFASTLAALSTAQDCTPELTSVHRPFGAFGAALTAESDLLVVGAPERDAPGPGVTVHPYGRAEAFEYDPVTRSWRSLGIIAPTPTPLPVVNNVGFGSALALGEHTVFCAWPDDITGGNGTVRAFLRQPAGWFEEPPILPPMPSATGRFGVSLAAQGQLVVIGEQLGNGRVHIATRTAVLGWRVIQTLEPTASVHGTFGRSVALDDEWLFVGDPGHPASLSGRGSVEVYRRDASGVWRFAQRLAAAPAGLNDHFGLSLAARGGRLAVGDDLAPSLIGGIGAVFVFEHDHATGLWTQRARLSSPMPVNAQGFASSVALDGDALLVGSPNESVASAARAGSAFLYRRDPATGSWSFVRRFTSEPPTADAFAGTAVAVGDWHAALGAPGVERVRAVPADPTRDVDFDTTLDACEALFHPTPCPALPNASGAVGRIHVDGSTDVHAADLRLAADQLTLHSFGYFIVSRMFDVVAQPPAGSLFGQLCLGGAIGRILPVLDAGAAGRVHFVLDPQVIPQPNGPVSAQPGETWYFQYWHRDLVAVTQRVSAFTEAARVVFR
jgi:hypothetical protein